jgi:polyisoprenoid-binding protein YceI
MGRPVPSGFRTRTSAAFAASLLAVLAGNGVGGPGVRPQVEYYLDSASSRMLMYTRTEGLISAFAPNYRFTFTSFGGTLTLTEGALTPACFVMVTNADSVRLLDDVSPDKRRGIEHMLKHEMLEVARFPQMVYRSSRIEVRKTGFATFRAHMEGTLSQHGVTRSCPISVEGVLMEEAVRLRGSFSILQSDYGMRPKVFAGGMVKVVDRLNLSFALLARRKQTQGGSQ